MRKEIIVNNYLFVYGHDRQMNGFFYDVYDNKENHLDGKFCFEGTTLEDLETCFNKYIDKKQTKKLLGFFKDN